MVSEAVRQGATTTLVVAQLEFGAVVKVWVVQQAFPPTQEDKDYIDDLFKRVELATNPVLAKVNVDEILHDHLDRSSVGHISSTSHD
jgi:hypothetical protein